MLVFKCGLLGGVVCRDMFFLIVHLENMGRGIHL